MSAYEFEHGIDPNESSERRQRRLSDIVRTLLRDLGVSDEPLAEGMRQEFVDGLDRVPKEQLKVEEDCPICATPFLEDQYPLVVTLPCPGHHKFDLECVGKWLKSSSTCPMCRHDFRTRKESVASQSDDEEVYDDMYA